ncbi:MAG: ABC transporter permease, partial [Lentisphaerae bacterium]|nr:ABC transporter permease [Lentisphaerota bacterium]
IFVGVLASASGAVVGFGLGILQVGAVLEFSLLGLSSCARGFGIGVGEAIGLGTILTTLAAVYPTYVAAKMKPVEAMRVEV